MYFNTLTTEEFTFFANLFYVKKGNSYKKVVPPNIAEYLTAEAVSIWFGDDGSLKWKGKSNSVRFCTDSFEVEEVNHLRAALKANFQIDTTIQMKGGRPRIATREASYPQLRDRMLFQLYVVYFMKKCRMMRVITTLEKEFHLKFH